jgi:hypothetical protein
MKILELYVTISRKNPFRHGYDLGRQLERRLIAIDEAAWRRPADSKPADKPPRPRMLRLVSAAAAVRLGSGPGTDQRLDPRRGAGALLKAQDDQAGTRVRSVRALAMSIAFDTAAASGHPGVPSPAAWIAVRIAVSAVTIA